jgi:hypothetical protein
MSYYNYCDEYYTTSVDFGAGGYQDVEVGIDIEIDVEQIVNDLGSDLLDELDDDDIGDYVISNCNTFIPDLVEKACDTGLLEVVDAMLEKWVDGGEVECISDMMTKVKTALATLTQEQLDLDSKLGMS